MTFFHQPVMLEEVLHYLNPQLGDNFIDCTLGGGGHASAILERIGPQGKLLGIDLDPLAIQATKETTKNSKNLILVQDNFRNLNKIADVYKFDKIDGILLDLGLSSGQLQDHQRGFSFLAEGRLDMRFGQQTDLTAEKILNTYSQKELSEIFKNFGEEHLAWPIAKKIVEMRRIESINSPNQLVEIVAAVYKKYYRGKSKVNPATKIFQALRMSVNEEIENLKQVLPQAVGRLKTGGRIAVISFHSLEDKIVKGFFKQESRDCICPPQLPICGCKHQKTLKIITRKPLVPSEEEVAVNPRARSAKLRLAEKI